MPRELPREPCVSSAAWRLVLYLPAAGAAAASACLASPCALEGAGAEQQWRQALRRCPSPVHHLQSLPLTCRRSHWLPVAAQRVQRPSVVFSSWASAVRAPVTAFAPQQALRTAVSASSPSPWLWGHWRRLASRLCCPGLLQARRARPLERPQACRRCRCPAEPRYPLQNQHVLPFWDSGSCLLLRHSVEARLQGVQPLPDAVLHAAVTL